MKILAIDIGAGTEDVLLYDDEKSSVENCIKMVKIFIWNCSPTLYVR